MKTFFSALYARNHRNYRHSIVPVGSSASLLWSNNISCSQVITTRVKSCFHQLILTISFSTSCSTVLPTVIQIFIFSHQVNVLWSIVKPDLTCVVMHLYVERSAFRRFHRATLISDESFRKYCARDLTRAWNTSVARYQAMKSEHSNIRAKQRIPQCTKPDEPLLNAAFRVPAISSVNIEQRQYYACVNLHLREGFVRGYSVARCRPVKSLEFWTHLKPCVILPYYYPSCMIANLMMTTCEIKNSLFYCETKMDWHVSV